MKAEAARKAGQAFPHRVDFSYADVFDGFPPCSGVAMGFDRFFMALTGRADIRDALIFPFEDSLNGGEPKFDMFDLIRSRLFRQQFIPLFMIMAMLLVMFSAIIFMRTRDGIVARELQIGASYRDAVLGSLDRWLDDRVTETERLAGEIEAAAADGQDLAAFWKRFSAMTGPGSSYTDIFLVDPSGLVVVSKAQTITRAINLSDRDYVVAGLSGRPFVSGLFQGRLSGTYVFAISQPVHIGSSGHWVLAGIVSLSNLAAIVDTLDLAEIGRAILVDSSGQYRLQPGIYRVVRHDRRREQGIHAYWWVPRGHC
jgi:hypothetical protein